MSSCLILQEHDRFFIGADTAVSAYVDKILYRYSNDGQKIFTVANDTLFCSGNMRKANDTIEFCNNIILEDGIDIFQLSTYLRQNYPNPQSSNVFDVELMIGRILRGKSVIYQLSQYNDFTPVIHTVDEGNVKILSAGINTELTSSISIKNMKLGLSVNNIYIHTFKTMISEQVGGWLIAYCVDENGTRNIMNFHLDNLSDNRFVLKDINKYLVIADVIVGQLVVGEKLKLSGSGAELDLSANNAITGLSAEFNVSIGGLRSEFTDYKTTTNSSISTMQSSITQNTTDIALKVSSTDYNGDTIVGKINVSSKKIEQSALNIDLTGYVTFNSLSTSGQTIIDGGNIKTGTITGITIMGNRIETYANNGYFLSSAWNGNQYGTWVNETRIENGEIKVGRTTYSTSGYTREINTLINAVRIYSNEVAGSVGNFDTLEIGNIGRDGSIIFNTNYEFRPKANIDCSIGTSSYPWRNGHFKNLYLDGKEVEKSVSALYLQTNSSYYADLTINGLLPSKSNLSIGSSTQQWSRGYFGELFVGGQSVSSYIKPYITSIYSTHSTSHYITLDSARDLVPNILTSASSNTPFGLGNNNYRWDTGYIDKIYAKDIYVNGALFTKVSINSLYNSTSHYVTFNSSGQLIPNTSSSSYNFELGSSSLPWDRVNVKTFYQNGGSVGFFGVTPVTRRSVNKSSGTPTVTTNQTKINEIITALTQLGLFNS